MNSSFSILTILVLLLVTRTWCLKCYRCGTYTRSQTGSLIPCNHFNDSNLKECDSPDDFCLKYVNKGITVRQCLPNCKSEVEAQSESFCCREDGCNEGTMIKSAVVVVVTTLVTAALNFLRH